MKWISREVLIKDLKGHPKNPRKISKSDLEGLKTSIDKFGQCQHIVCNTDGTIIGGHQRVKALKSQNKKTVIALFPEETLSDVDVDELNIRLNRNAGEWDFDILKDQWDVSSLLEWGFDASEFPTIDQLEFSEEEDGQEEKELPKEPKTSKGALYILGDHRLLCGDSTNPDDVAKLLDGAEPILMVTDPPYGVKYDPSWREIAVKTYISTGKVQNDDQHDWSIAWSLFPGSVAYVWHAGKYAAEVSNSLSLCDFQIKSHIIWVKQQPAISRGDYHWQHESCWYAVKKGHKHNWQGSRKESTIWEIANHSCAGGNKTEEKNKHGTQKPMECMGRPIKNNSAEGEGVYDPFVGSGTTLIACENLKRKCFAMEIDPGYCDLIVERWQNYRRKNGKDDAFEVLYD